jgi:hypothetical protein
LKAAHRTKDGGKLLKSPFDSPFGILIFFLVSKQKPMGDKIVKSGYQGQITKEQAAV